MADDPHPHDAADEDLRSRADRATSPLGTAVAQAQRALIDGVHDAGGRVLCAVMIVHAAGIQPNGAVEVFTEEKADGGPETPRDVIELALGGIAQYAGRTGIPFAVMDAPDEAIGGQG